MNCYLLILFFLLSCSGKILRPPSSDYILKTKSIINNNQTPNEEDDEEGITRDFFLAKSLMIKDPSTSCILLKRILDKKIYEKTFPLRDLIIIKQMSVCPFNKEEAKNFWKDSPHQSLSSWAHEDYFREAQKLSEKNGDQEAYADWTFRLAKFEKTTSNKEKYIHTALTIAKSLNLKSKIKEYKTELYKMSPRFNEDSKEINPDSLYKIAYDNEKNRKFINARVFYEKIIQNELNDPKIRIKALQRIIFCYKKDRDIDNYILARKRFVHFFETLIKKYPFENKYLRYKIHAQIRFARATWSKRGREEAMPLVINLLMELESAPIKMKGFLAQAHWLLGNMRNEENKNEEALIHFSHGLHYCQKAKSLCNNLAWAFGWEKYNQKKYLESELTFHNFLAKINNRSDQQRFIFWLAKSLVAQGKLEDAKILFDELINYDPYSYFALLSYREKKELVPGIEETDPVDSLIIDEFDWALALDEKEIAQKVLDLQSRKINNNSMREQIIPLYVKINSYQNALGEFQKLSKKYRKENYARNAPFIFPIAFKSEIYQFSKKFSVPPFLMTSIIRQESSFNQYARSPADAFGPMQLIPEAAKIISKKYKLPYENMSDLYNPEINIGLGAGLLRDLMNEHQNRLIPVVASYNAGSMPVKRWESERESNDCSKTECNTEEQFEAGIKFIESIPYEETKKYVKLVFRNMVIYNAIEKKESFPLPIELFSNLTLLSF